MMDAMRIALIDNYDSFSHLLKRLIEDASGGQVEVTKNDHVDFELLQNSDCIVLSPGAGLPEEAGSTMEVIEMYHHIKPILGICLGHQALGYYFGAELKLLDTMAHGLRAEIFPENAPGTVFSGIEKPVIAGRYHSWVLDDNNFPDFLEVTSRDGMGNIMAIRHRSLPLTGLQFHPESCMSNCGKELLENFFRSVIPFSLPSSGKFEVPETEVFNIFCQK